MMPSVAGSAISACIIVFAALLASTVIETRRNAAMAERTCRWRWAEEYSDTPNGRECLYANWIPDCGCWSEWDSDFEDYDDPADPPRDFWRFCPRCGKEILP